VSTTGKFSCAKYFYFSSTLVRAFYFLLLTFEYTFTRVRAKYCSLSIWNEMALISTILLAIALPYTAWYFQSLFVNYRKARQSGFPLLVCPANTDNVIWIVFAVAFRSTLARFLPAFIYNRVKPAIYGWEFLYRNEVFERLGSSFILVTPGKNELWVADPETAHPILIRRNDFLQLPIASRRLATLTFSSLLT